MQPRETRLEPILLPQGVTRKVGIEMNQFVAAPAVVIVFLRTEILNERGQLNIADSEVAISRFRPVFFLAGIGMGMSSSSMIAFESSPACESTPFRLNMIFITQGLAVSPLVSSSYLPSVCCSSRIRKRSRAY